MLNRCYTLDKETQKDLIMSASQPYQPFLFRLLHGLNSLLVCGCIITGYLVYESYDRRFGTLWLIPEDSNLIDIHGTWGFFLFFTALAFTYYSLRQGKKRLIQPDTLAQLKRTPQPIWWYTLHRLTNTIALLALALAVISGKFQDENWLRVGETHHLWYNVHLVAWGIMIVAIALHVLMAARVGGFPLLLSMANSQIRPSDHPRLWWDNFRNWLKRPRF